MYRSDSHVHSEFSGDSKEKLEKMKEVIKKLGEDFNYSRIDLYLINEKIYFGEITFCAESGFGDFDPIEWDYKFGQFL